MTAPLMTAPSDGNGISTADGAILTGFRQHVYVAEKTEYKLGFRNVRASNENTDAMQRQLHDCQIHVVSGMAEICVTSASTYSGNRRGGLSDLLKSAMSSISDKHWLM